MKPSTLLAFAVLSLPGCLSIAQAPPESTPAPAAPPAAATSSTTSTPATTPANGTYTLHDGDEVALKFAEDLSSKTATDGQPVNFVVDGDIKAGDVVVIKSGTKAIGEVTNAKRAGMMGKGAELSVRIDYVRVGDTKVRLRGAKGKQGDNATGSTVALTVLFGPIGLIKHGHEIDIKAGSPLKVYLDDNVSLPPAS